MVLGPELTRDASGSPRDPQLEVGKREELLRVAALERHDEILGCAHVTRIESRTHFVETCGPRSGSHHVSKSLA